MKDTAAPFCIGIGGGHFHSPVASGYHETQLISPPDSLLSFVKLQRPSQASSHRQSLDAKTAVDAARQLSESVGFW